MTDRREVIAKAIEQFPFSNFGFDIVDETKEDPDTCEWIYALAERIDQALGN